MPFYRMDFPDGSTAIVHMKLALRRPPKPCPWPDFDDPAQPCRRMGDALCDAPVEGRADGVFTCDKVMCERHRTHVGRNVDFCPEHAHLAPARLPLEAVGATKVSAD